MEGIGQVEVVPLHAVLATCCLFVMAMLGYAEFDYFLSVLTPVHLIFYIYGGKVRNKKMDLISGLIKEKVKKLSG